MPRSLRAARRPVTALSAVRDASQGEERRLSGSRIGTLTGFDAGGRPTVDFPGNPHGEVVAEFLAHVLPIPAEGARVLITFDQERSSRPIIVGVIGRVALGELGKNPIELKVDGERMLLEARDQLEIRCGEASILLRRNGRVVIKGAYVESHARGVNRIKGSSVKVN